MFAELKRRIINGGTLSTRLSGRLACTWLVLGVAISAVPAASGAQVPVSCPRVYYFNDIGTLTTEWNGKYYVFRFHFGWGETTSPFIGWAHYLVDDSVTDDLRATYLDPWKDVNCTRILVPIPPYTTPQPVLVMTELNWGGTLIWNFTPPPEDDECWAPLENITSTDDEPTPRVTRESFQNEISATITCEAGNPGPGFNPGGGSGGTEYEQWCLFMEISDEYGTVTDRIPISCWWEPAVE